MSAPAPAGIDRRTAFVDLVVLVAIGAGWMVSEYLAVPKRYSFVAMAVVLGALGLVLARRGADASRELGFRGDNLRSSLIPIGGVTVALATAIVGYAAFRGVPILRADLLLLLPLYPVWGVVQQAVFQGLIHRRLRALLPGAALPIVGTAALFAAVHAGNGVLVVLTFAAGLVWSILYRRWPNLWLLGMSHGVLAALAYPLVLREAPLETI